MSGSYIRLVPILAQIYHPLTHFNIHNSPKFGSRLIKKEHMKDILIIKTSVLKEVKKYQTKFSGLTLKNINSY